MMPALYSGILENAHPSEILQQQVPAQAPAKTSQLNMPVLSTQSRRSLWVIL